MTLWINPKTGKGWSDREEGIIAHLFGSEPGIGTRIQAIQAMRRRKLDDLEGRILPPDPDFIAQTSKAQLEEKKAIKRAINKSLQEVLSSTVSITSEIEHVPSQLSENSDIEFNSLQTPDYVQDVDRKRDRKRGRKKVFINSAERVAVHRAAKKELSEVSFLPLPEGAQIAPNRPPRARPKINRTRKDALIARQDGKCLFCERLFGTWIRKGPNGVPRCLQAQEEHFIPRGEPGSRAHANFNVACQICNYFKGRRQFHSIEECRAWLVKMWDYNDFRSLGRLQYQRFEHGEYYA